MEVGRHGGDLAGIHGGARQRREVGEGTTRGGRGGLSGIGRGVEKNGDRVEALPGGADGRRRIERARFRRVRWALGEGG